MLRGHLWTQTYTCACYDITHAALNNEIKVFSTQQSDSRYTPLQWRHNERDCIQFNSHTILYSTVYSRPKSKTISKLRVTGVCERNSPVTGEFPAQRPVTRKMFTSDYVNMLTWQLEPELNWLCTFGWKKCTGQYISLSSGQNSSVSTNVDWYNWR